MLNSSVESRKFEFVNSSSSRDISSALNSTFSSGCCRLSKFR